MHGWVQGAGSGWWVPGVVVRAPVIRDGWVHRGTGPGTTSMTDKAEPSTTTSLAVKLKAEDRNDSYPLSGKSKLTMSDLDGILDFWNIG